MRPATAGCASRAEPRRRARAGRRRAQGARDLLRGHVRVGALADVGAGDVGQPGRLGDAEVDAGEPLPLRTDIPYAEAKQAALTAFERRYLGDILERVDGNLTAASREPGLDRKHLRTLCRRHGLIATPEPDPDPEE